MVAICEVELIADSSENAEDSRESCAGGGKRDLLFVGVVLAAEAFWRGEVCDDEAIENVRVSCRI